MSFADGAVRTVSGIAEVTTSSIGALGGAAVGSVVGGVRGAVSGVAGGTRQGIERGSHSTPAALLTMAAVGAVGLVDWPVIITVGGAALVLRQLHERGAQSGRQQPTMKTETRSAADGGPSKGAGETTPRKTSASATTTKRSTSKKTTAKKSTTTRPRGRTTR
ncbi:hypothetical protein [Prescottella agglutinans]|uniref:Transmembrane protein n=1 Tax=Prescottella agglutinans TaxID=1644129 RepID=A0ABT6MBB6_9NOCA|nr:hypothetical protein [Prescottella agglutinans]MDH6281596.1 hypothetical protein [Prescottella agglutinans]